MNICSWNVNSIRQRAHAAHNRLTPWLEAHKPDVVCLQELQCTAQQFPHAAVAQAGYRARVSAQKGKNGVAILMRLDAPMPTDVSAPWPPEPSLTMAPHEARFIAARVSGVVVASVYVPYGRTPDDAQWARKLHFLADIKTWAEGIIRSGQSLALVGDFNVAPSALDASSADALLTAGQPPPETLWPAWCDPRMRRALQALQDVGLHDVCALQPEQGRALTMWDERNFGRAAGFGVRVDLMLVSAAMVARLLDVRVHSAMRDGPHPSDHVPIEASFRRVDRIFGALSGSRLYGLDTPQSDTDIRGLFLPSRQYLLLGEIPKTELVQRPKAHGEKNNGHDVDLSFFSPTTFVRDLLAGQPCAWEMLFAPPAAYTPDTTALGMAFVGRLRARASSLWPREASATVAFADRSLNTYLRRRVTSKGTPMHLITFDDDAVGGANGKLLSHALRVLQQSLEMGTTGRITLPRPNGAELMAIKTGTATLNPVLEHIRAVKTQVQQLRLPNAGAAETNHHSQANQAGQAFALACVAALHDQHIMRSRWLAPVPSPWAPLAVPRLLSVHLAALDLAAHGSPHRKPNPQAAADSSGSELQPIDSPKG